MQSCSLSINRILSFISFFINEFSEIQFTAEDRHYEIGLKSDLTCLEQLTINSQVLAHASKLQSNLISRLKNKEDVSYRYEKTLLDFYVKENETYYNESVLQKLDSTLREIKSLCEAANAELIMVFVPGQIEVSQPSDIHYYPHTIDLTDADQYDMDQPFDHLEKAASNSNIPLINLKPFLKNHPSQPVYFPRSWHWNEEGHKVAAEAIVQELDNRNLIDRK